MIEAIVGAALEKGRLKRRQRRRIMSYPLVIRLMLAMTLMPDASYCHSLNVPGRQRHSKRARKARPKFAHASVTKQTVTGKPQVHVFAPGFS